jgi:hypothetical protein
VSGSGGATIRVSTIDDGSKIENGLSLALRFIATTQQSSSTSKNTSASQFGKHSGLLLVS